MCVYTAQLLTMAHALDFTMRKLCFPRTTNGTTMLKWLLCKLRNKYKFDCVRQSFSVHPKVTARNLYQLAADSGIHCFFVTKLACFPNLPSHILNDKQQKQ